MLSGNCGSQDIFKTSTSWKSKELEKATDPELLCAVQLSVVDFPEIPLRKTL